MCVHNGGVTSTPIIDRPVIDRFAGPGGWDQGIRPLGIRPLGIEHNPAACATAEAAGHRRLLADVAALDPRDFAPCWGGIDSPPCPGWTVAGSGGARRDAAQVLAALAAVHDLDDLTELLTHLRPTMGHPETLLALEPLRWALALRPAWLAWEQVREVLPLWQSSAEVLRRNGYTVATAVVAAEQYGVPSTRRRAILLARSPELSAELGPAAMPAPTHSRYHSQQPDRLDAGVKPWVSMGEALGWDRWPGASALSLRSNYGTGGDPRKRGMRRLGQPAPTVTGKINRNRWVTDPGAEHMVSAASQAFGIAAPGSSVTIAQASELQTFPAGYPWQGKVTDGWQQVGDAVPPLLARALVAEVAGLDDPER